MSRPKFNREQVKYVRQWALQLVDESMTEEAAKQWIAQLFPFDVKPFDWGTAIIGMKFIYQNQIGVLTSTNEFTSAGYDDDTLRRLEFSDGSEHLCPQGELEFLSEKNYSEHLKGVHNAKTLS